MTPYERRVAIEAIATQHRLAQFGQAHDASTANGATACSTTELQQLVLIWTGELHTLDEINQVAGYYAKNAQSIGMGSEGVDRVIAHWHLPYAASWRVGKPSVADIVTMSRELGPVFLEIRYAYYPLKGSLRATGIHATNGFAVQGGRNDMIFAGDHAVTLIGARWLPGQQTYAPRLTDPDHGSKSRPHIPPFDIVSYHQLGVLWNAPLRAGYNHIAYLPTKAWEGSK